jgi:hypothetical protein
MAHAPAYRLRDAGWLAGERARVYGTMVALGLAVMTGWLLLAPPHPGLPGGDFVSFYAASFLALGGDPAAAWNPQLHAAAQQLALGPHAGYLAFLYPPPYLLACWPLALLPFGAACAAWTATTLAAALAGYAAFLRRVSPIRYLPLLLFVLPGTWINVLAGQNGALTLAILAAGFAFVDRRPFVAGLVLGLMAIKPQLAVVLPFVLVAAGRWKALFGAALGAAALLLAAWPAVGNAGYAAFLSSLTDARAALEAGAVDPALMQSVFGMLQPWSPAAAYAVQAIVAAAVLAVACHVARRTRPDGPALGALCAIATLAATPFVLDYDLTLLALPIGWIVARGAAAGFRPWEKLGSMLCGAAPLAARTLSLDAGLHLLPPLSLALLLLVARRLAGSEAGAPMAVAPSAAG